MTALDNFAKLYQDAYNSQVTNAQRNAQLLIQREENARREALARDQLAQSAEQFRVTSALQSNLAKLNARLTDARIAGLDAATAQSTAAETRAAEQYALYKSLGLPEAQVKAIISTLARTETGAEQLKIRQEVDQTIAQARQASELARGGNISGANKLAESLNLEIRYGFEPTGGVAAFRLGPDGEYNVRANGLDPVPGTSRNPLAPTESPTFTPSVTPDSPGDANDARARSPSLDAVNNNPFGISPEAIGRGNRATTENATPTPANTLARLGRALDTANARFGGFTRDTPSADFISAFDDLTRATTSFNTERDATSRLAREAIPGSREDREYKNLLSLYSSAPTPNRAQRARDIYQPNVGFSLGFD
jgi:hypothetical protein